MVPISTNYNLTLHKNVYGGIVNKSIQMDIFSKEAGFSSTVFTNIISTDETLNMDLFINVFYIFSLHFF